MKALKSFLGVLIALCLVLGMMLSAPITTFANTGMQPDIINVDFASGAQNAVTTEKMPALVADSGSTVKLTPDMVLGQTVATFDGTSGFGYTLPAETLDLISNGGYTVELMLKSTDLAPAYVFGDCYGVAGVGLEINSDHVMTYYQKNTGNSNYRQCWFDATESSYKLNDWMHVTLTCDTASGHTEMYVNGVSYDYSNQGESYVLAFPNGDNVLYIGGNSNNGAFAEGMKGSIAYFRMYSHVATTDEAQELYEAQAADMADILCIDYSNGTADELLADGPALVAGSGNTASFEADEELKRNVAVFDGQSGFGYTMKDSDYAKMANGYTFEALIKLNEAPATTNQYGSSIIGCMNEGSGFGLMGTVDNSMQYWFGKRDADGNYRQLWLNGSGSSPVDVDQWLHVMVTYDGGTYYYYVNGQRHDYVSPGELGYLADPANILYVGGAPDENGAFRIGMKGSVGYVKMYSASKTADEIATLYENALKQGSSNAVIGNNGGGDEGGDTLHTNSSNVAFDGDFDEENVTLSFAAMSDIHIATSETARDAKFVNSLTKAKELLGAENLKGVLVAGDIGDSSPLEEYAKLKGMLDANLDPSVTEFLPTIGNHDYYFQGAFSGRNSFRDLLGEHVYQNPVSGNTEAEITRGNYHTVINGIHFISVFGMDGNHASSDVDWLDKQLAVAAKDTPNMPVIVYSHVQAANTVIDDEDDPTETRWYSTTIGETLKKYSNVVYFAGHTHATADIWNDGSYTAVGTGCINKNMMTVQVDATGNVRISVYPTSTDISQMNAATKVWTFATKAYVPSEDGNGNNNNNNNNNNTNNNNNSSNNNNNNNNNSGNVNNSGNSGSNNAGTGNNTDVSNSNGSPITGDTITSILTAIVSMGFIVLTALFRKRIFS